MIRSLSSGGGAIGGDAIGSASAAGRSSSTSSRQTAHVARCASNSLALVRGSAPST